MKAFDISELIVQEIRSLDDNLPLKQVTAPFSKLIKQVDLAYEELSQINEHRERYNLNWAFRHANDQLQRLLTEVYSEKLHKKIESYSRRYKNRKVRGSIDFKFRSIQRLLTDRINRTRTSPRGFETARTIILITEIGITLLIVLGVAQLATYINATVSLPKLSLLFVSIFGLLRMVLHKIKEVFLFNAGWEMYQNTVDKAFEGFAILMATSFILAYHVKQGTFLENELGEILTKSVQDLKRPPDKEQRRRRKAKHRSARLREKRLRMIEDLKKKIEREAVKQAYSSAGLSDEIDDAEKETAEEALEITGSKDATFDMLISSTHTPYTVEEEMGDDLLERKEEARMRVKALFSDLEPERESRKNQLQEDSFFPPETIEKMKENSKQVFSYLSGKFNRKDRSSPSKKNHEDSVKTGKTEKNKKTYSPSDTMHALKNKLLKNRHEAQPESNSQSNSHSSEKKEAKSSSDENGTSDESRDSESKGEKRS
ncbi:MAG: hypothetical protein K9L75_01345 [Spirochaetia bacterium]|nr:hypothetical protein [Spirochaetia bacterium]